MPILPTRAPRPRLYLGPLLLTMAACSSAPPDAEVLRELPPAPYKVLVVFAAKDRGTDQLLQPFWGELAGALEWYGTFGSFEWISRESVLEKARARDVTEERILVEAGKRLRADRIVYVWLDPGEMKDLGPNAGAWASGPLWLLAGFPGWIIGDRSYDASFSVATQVLAVEEDAVRTDPESLVVPEVRLDLFERGFDWWTLLVPPFLLDGDPDDWRPLADDRYRDYFVRTLVERFKTTPLPPNDYMIRFRQDDLGGSEQSVFFRIDGVAEVDSVELQVNEEVLAQWTGSQLLDRRVDSPVVVRYDFEVQVPLQEATAELRVVVTIGNLVRTGTITLRGGVAG